MVLRIYQLKHTSSLSYGVSNQLSYKEVSLLSNVQLHNSMRIFRILFPRCRCCCYDSGTSSDGSRGGWSSGGSEQPRNHLLLQRLDEAVVEGVNLREQSHQHEQPDNQ